MKRIIFTCLICLVGIASIEAQSKSKPKKTNRNALSNKSTTTQLQLRDRHWQLSEYRPEVSKKDQKELNKSTKKQQSRSYTADKSPYYKKAEAKEIKAKRVRQQRLKDEKALEKERKTKMAKRESDKRYMQRQRMTSQKVNKNKKNFGTRASRRKFNNQSELFAPKPQLYN